MSNTSYYGNSQVQPGQEDPRYRISVFLVSKGRPKYWEFHCIKCRSKVAELSGNLVMVADIDNLDNYTSHPAPVVVLCKGSYCKWRYEFVTLSTR